MVTSLKTELVMPTSDRYTPRVVLISGGYIQKLLLMKNINWVAKDKAFEEGQAADRADQPDS